MSLRSSGSLHSAQVVQDVTTTSPTRALRYRTALQATSTVETTLLSADVALSIGIWSKLNSPRSNTRSLDHH